MSRIPNQQPYIIRPRKVDARLDMRGRLGHDDELGEMAQSTCLAAGAGGRVARMVCMEGPHVRDLLVCAVRDVSVWSYSLLDYAQLLILALSLIPLLFSFLE
jgi:hypothetical protein